MRMDTEMTSLVHERLTKKVANTSTVKRGDETNFVTTPTRSDRPSDLHLKTSYQKIELSDPILSEIKSQSVLFKDYNSGLDNSLGYNYSQSSMKVLEDGAGGSNSNYQYSNNDFTPALKVEGKFCQSPTFVKDLDEDGDKRRDTNGTTGIASSKNVSDSDLENVYFKGSCLPQIFAALAANFGSFALGAVLSWTATALPDLREKETLGKLTQFEESWIGSTALLGAVASCPVVGYGIEHFGRRRSMLLLTVPFVAGWLLITFAQNVAMIYAGRFMTGFCGGGFSVAAPVYITETSNAKIRGALASGFDMMITVGILYIFLIGSYISWQWQALACGLIPVAFHILMFFTPESPRYLVEKGKHAEASKALCWLHGATSSQQVETELTELIASVDESKERSCTWRDLLKIEVLKPTSIGLILMLNQQLSGIDAIMFYTVDIFRSAGSDMNENTAAIIVGGIQVLATITSALLVDRCGRRFLLMLSEVFMVISLGAMGLYFHLKKLNDGVVPEHLGWLPLSSLIVYVVSFSVGFGPTPWLIMGEILPPHVKGLASGLVTITRWLLGFIVTIIFKDLMRILGEDGGYWFFASCCFLGGFYVYFVVPETKGKTLDEIQEYFNKSRPSGEPSQDNNDDDQKNQKSTDATKPSVATQS